MYIVVNRGSSPVLDSEQSVSLTPDGLRTPSPRVLNVWHHGGCHCLPLPVAGLHWLSLARQHSSVSPHRRRRGRPCVAGAAGRPCHGTRQRRSGRSCAAGLLADSAVTPPSPSRADVVGFASALPSASATAASAARSAAADATRVHLQMHLSASQWHPSCHSRA